jgi:hypothetical protein
MLPAKLAVLCHLKPVGVVFLVLLGVIVALFAFHTGQSNFHSHIITAPPVNYLAARMTNMPPPGGLPPSEQLQSPQKIDLEKRGSLILS